MLATPHAVSASAPSRAGSPSRTRKCITRGCDNLVNPPDRKCQKSGEAGLTVSGARAGINPPRLTNEASARLCSRLVRLGWFGPTIYRRTARPARHNEASE
jgi:hypothetical protein